MDLQHQPQQQIANCAVCFTTQQLLRCAKCKSAFYCSVAHQHIDWPAHKQHCRILAKQKKNNTIKFQQMQHAVAFNNGPQAPLPTTTFPLAAAGAAPTEQMTLANVNGLNYGHFGGNGSYAGNYVDAGLNTNQNQQSTVIYGANENLFLNSQPNVVNNMLVDPTATTTAVDMDQQQYYIAPNTTNISNVNLNMNMNNVMQETSPPQVLSTLSELTLQQDAPSPTFNQQPNQQSLSPQHQLMQPQQQQQQPNFEQNHYDLQPPPISTQQPSPQTYAHFRFQNSQHEKSSSYQIGQGDEYVMANFNERRYEELCRNIINDMNQYGLSVVDDFLGVEKGMDILGEVHDMYCAGVFQDGQLVNNRKTEQDLNRTIRGDKITWVKGVEPGCTSVGYLINQIDAVICRANSMKNNGKLGYYNIKERTKAMVACYPGSGTQYVTHVDNPNKDGRVITAIYYLNVDWDAKRSGGVLRIFPEASNTVADIEPKFDRLIFFWSDKRNPHEVQPSHRTRYAITVWYFDANEREAALNRCKYGSVTKAPADPSTSDSSTSTKSNFHHNNSSSSNSNNSNSQKSNCINNSSNISHLPAEFSKANENSNPNFNANAHPATTTPQQTNLHKKEICA